MSEYLQDGRPVVHEQFVRHALDPQASAVVEACAGSGKTWLLVGRIVRLLLAGAAPSQILAITFTRRAAQEMRQRLSDDLAELASADDRTALALLNQRGLSESAAAQALPAARGLYERVAGAERGVSIETFHGWFWRLLRGAPLASGVPHTAALLESPRRLLEEAWVEFAAGLLEAGGEALSDYEELVTLIGDGSADRLLRNFANKRAEWRAFGEAGRETAIARAGAPMRAALRAAGFSDTQHPGEVLRQPRFLDALRAMIGIWQAVPKPGKTVQSAIEDARLFLDGKDGPRQDVVRASNVLLTLTAGTPIKALQPADLSKHLAASAAAVYAPHYAVALDALQRVCAAEMEWDALRLNECGLRCGERLLQAYERRKRQADVLDFTDIEWHADRLLRDESTAAYMQASLDARYRHLLVDEFQDTSTLQWRALRGWLDAYGADADRPTVFLVGDPKQSIYRFRRAEPRVFDAAIRYLTQHLQAVHLRTNVTRRNPAQIVTRLDAVFDGRNPLYQPQTSHAHAEGHFVLLPLAQAGKRADAQDAADDAAAAALRDVLSQPRETQRPDPHVAEGRQLGDEIGAWVARLQIAQGDAMRPARWSDAVVLMRRRTHMAALESAFRAAGIPTLADRRGGLLGCPEIEDLCAVLEFLCAEDDLSLAHTLRAPLFACSDEDLLRLASAQGPLWWDRLLALPDAGEALQRARTLLTAWLPAAGVLPVHDLLDRIFHQAGVRARYAACVPRERLVQVQANFDAFLELALGLDSGRFPTLTRFLEDVRWTRERDAESIDEGPTATEDAVRLMTIHGAKGLEAPIVAIADTSSQDGPEDRYDVLLNWPPDADGPEHFSLIGRTSRAGAGRRRWIDAERAQAEQEDWNLLYVAMTRAREVLIVSGVESRGTADHWYRRLLAAAPADAAPERAPALPAASDDARSYFEFRPEPTPLGRREATPESDAMRIGKAWHALLEHGGEADDAQLGEWCVEFSLDAAQMQQAVAAARRVREAPALARFFGAQARAWNELEAVDAAGQMLRIDRLVELDDAVWILDYKWRCLDQERAAYRQQLARYAAAIAPLQPGRALRTALVLADGTFIEMDGLGEPVPGADKMLGGGPPRIEAP